MLLCDVIIKCIKKSVFLKVNFQFSFSLKHLPPVLLCIVITELPPLVTACHPPMHMMHHQQDVKCKYTTNTNKNTKNLVEMKIAKHQKYKIGNGRPIN